MKKHYDFSQSARNPYASIVGLEELMRALKNYRAQGPMTREQFGRWWNSLSADSQAIIDAIVRKRRH